LTTSISFSEGHLQDLIETKLESQIGEMRSTHIATTEICHPSFIFFWIFIEYQICHCEFDGSISEKFEALIVLLDSLICLIEK
jgi:hypothetical protein